MSTPEARRTALILSPGGAAGRANDPASPQAQLHSARLYNLIELLDSLDWDAQVWEPEVTPTTWSVKLIYIQRTGLGDDGLLQAERTLGRGRAEFLILDWTDIDELRLAPDLDVATLTRPEGRTPTDTLRGWLTPSDTDINASLPSLEDGLGGDPVADRLPVVVGCGSGLRTIWTHDGQLEGEALDSWEDVETTATDSTSSCAISADGRLCVVLRGRTATLSWLTMRGEDVAHTRDARGDVELPELIGPDPRIVAAAATLGGTIRLTITDGTQTWRLFLTLDGEVSARPIRSSLAEVKVGIDVLSDAVLFGSDGRQVTPSEHSTMFRGMRVYAVDAAFSGGVAVVAALGKRSGSPIIQVKRRRGGARWELLDLGRALHEAGIRTESISGLTVGRRLDDLEPSHMVIAVGAKAHAVELPQRAGSQPTQEFGEMSP